MSWDAIIMRFGDAETLDDLSSDFEPLPISSSTELQMTLRDLFPDEEHCNDQSSLSGEGFWLELNHGCHTDQLGRVSAIGARSNAGIGAIQQIEKLCNALQARLLDIQTGEFADFSTETENSFAAFTEWRNHVLSDCKEKNQLLIL